MIVSKLRLEDERNIKRLLALELFGEKVIKKTEQNAKKIYDLIVDGRKVKTEVIITKNGAYDKNGNMLFLLKDRWKRS